MKTCKLSNGDLGVKCINSSGLLCTNTMTCKAIQGSVSISPTESELHAYASQNTTILIANSDVLGEHEMLCEDYIYNRLYNYYILNGPWED